MWQVGSACYSSELAAASAAASSQVGQVIQVGSTAYAVNVDAVASNSITYVLTPFGGGSALSLVAPFTAQSCGLLTAADGLQLGWLVAAVILGALAVMLLTRGFRDGYG